MAITRCKAEIQGACPDDAADIAAVHLSSLRAAYQGQLPDPVEHLVLEPSDVELRSRMWTAWLERSQANTIVARVDGTVTGFCTVHPMPGAPAKGVTGEIPAIYVLPSHWRRGIGRLLCEQALTQARTRGFAEVVLWVLESNQRARRFYSSLGFTPDGGKRVFLEHSGSSLHELRYRRETSQAAVEVSFRDVAESDLPILLEQQLDPVANGMAAVKPRDEKEFMAHWRRNILRDETVVKKAVLLDGQVVGHIASFERAGKREVGYWIGREYWGKGIASEALARFLRHDSERPLFAIVAKHNIASIRVLEKCGFAITGGSRRAEDARGLEVDELTLKLDGNEGP